MKSLSLSFDKKNKSIIFLLTFTFVTMFYLPNISTASILKCTITQDSSCPGTVVLKMSNLTNAHVETPQENNYAYRVCCNLTHTTLNVNVRNSCLAGEEEFISLSSSTNAHVEFPRDKYPLSICLSSGVGGIECGLSQSCPILSTCVLSVSDAAGCLSTNSHVGDCKSYPTKICCNFTCSQPGDCPPCENNVFPTCTNKNCGCALNCDDDNVDGSRCIDGYCCSYNIGHAPGKCLPIGTINSTPGKNDKKYLCLSSRNWKSCCESGCDYSHGEFAEIGTGTGNEIYCCDRTNGWQKGGCECSKISPKIEIESPSRIILSGGYINLSVSFACANWTMNSKDFTLVLQINEKIWVDCFLTNKNLTSTLNWNRDECDSSSPGKKPGGETGNGYWYCDEKMVCKHRQYPISVFSDMSRGKLTLNFTCKLPNLRPGRHTIKITPIIYESEIMLKPYITTFFVASTQTSFYDRIIGNLNIFSNFIASLFEKVRSKLPF